jgi:hypothetical protein
VPPRGSAIVTGFGGGLAEDVVGVGRVLLGVVRGVLAAVVGVLWVGVGEDARVLSATGGAPDVADEHPLSAAATSTAAPRACRLDTGARLRSRAVGAQSARRMIATRA